MLPLLNHVIQQNTEIQADLAEFAGRSLQLEASGLRVKGVFDRQGFLQDFDGQAETEIVFRPSAVQKILSGQKPGVGDVAVNGDTALGMAVLPLVGQLRYYANDDLSRLFGDAVVGSVSSRAERLGQTLKQIGRGLAGQLGSFAQEPESPVVGKETFESWRNGVEQLRDDVARLEARLNKLERRNQFITQHTAVNCGVCERE